MEENMKRTFVKVLAFALALAMLAGTFITVAYAEDAAKCPGEGKRHTLENTPNYTLVKVFDPVCDNAGYTSYTCDDCGDPFVDSFVEAPNTAHNWSEVVTGTPASCGVAGAKDYQTCSICKDYLIEGKRYSEAEGPAAVVIPALEHEYIEGDSTGTCLEKGETTYTCKHCGDSYTEPVDGKGEGHKWVLVSVDNLPGINEDGTVNHGSATYKCSVCNTTESFPVICFHDEKTPIPAVDPTCTETGLTEGAKCSICGFITVAQQEVPALGHKEVIDAAVDPTCTTTGLTEGRHCEVCYDADKSFFVPQDTIDVAHCKGSSAVEFGAVVGNCTTKEVVAGEKCSVCGEVWTEPEEKDFVHVEVDVVTDPTCTNSGHSAKYCDLCHEMLGKFEIIDPIGHTENLTYEEVVANGLLIGDKIDATCENDGVYNYYCKNGCGTALSVTIPKTGHKTEKVEVDATCSKYAYTYTYCTNENCEYALVANVTVEDVEYDLQVNGADVKYAGDIKVDVAAGYNEKNHSNLVTEDIINQPTCTLAGNKSEYCSDCGYKDLLAVIPALGHSYNRENPTWDADPIVTKPTCTEKGYTTYGCTDCDATTINVQDGDDVPANGHKEKEVPAVAPDCENSGLKAGKVCEVCGTTTVEQEIDPAIGHHYEYSETVEPRCTGVNGTDGYDIYTCSNANCPNPTEHRNFVSYEWDASKKYTSEEAAQLNHNLDPDNIVEKISQTCTVEGLLIYECLDCGQKVAVIIPAEHSWGAEDVQVDPTCTTTGTEAGKTCTVCGAKDGYAEIPALGHDFADAWTYDETNHWYDCSRCDVDDQKATHSYTSEITTAPKCEETGIKTFTCECGHTYTEVVDATGHDFADTWTYDETNHWYVCQNGCLVVDQKGTHNYSSEVIVAPTCTTTGTTKYTCECGYSYEETTDALGHSWKATANKSTLGCETDQYNEWACETCKIVELRDYLPAHGHNVVIDAAVAPDCDTTGLTEGNHCTHNCDSTDPAVNKAQEVVPATGIHTNANGEIHDTCIDTNENRHCDGCNTDIPMSHLTIADITFEATCVDNGYTVSLCKDCGEWLSAPTNVTAPTGNHAWSEWKTTTPATCTTKGEQTRYCATCDATETQPTAEDPSHNFVITITPPTCTENGYTTYDCQDCDVVEKNRKEGDDVPALGHLPSGEYGLIEGVTPENEYEVDQAEREICDRCGEQFGEARAKQDLKFTFEAVNAVKPGADFVNSGRIAINVYVSAHNWNKLNTITLSFNFKNLTYVKMENGDLGFSIYDADATEDKFTLLAMGEYQQPVVVDGQNILLATVIFDINTDMPTDVNNQFSVYNVVAACHDIEQKEIDAKNVTTGNGLAETYYTLGDANKDGKIDAADAQVILAMSQGKIAYDARADFDKNGVINPTDFAAIRKYIVGTYDYSEISLPKANPAS